MKRYRLAIFTIFSLLFHFSLLAILDLIKVESIPMGLEFKKDKPLKIVNIRTVGKEEGLKDAVPVQKKPNKNKKLLDRKIVAKDLSVSPAQNLAIDEFKQKRRGKATLLAEQKKKFNPNLSINNSKIKAFLTNDPYSLPAESQMTDLELADVLFDLEIPKGVPEDELNKHELVFYSFRKRTALAYVNSFQKNLNIFETRNPHLNFPLTSEPETIAGKITYDKNGDILRIETLRYTQIAKLQDFFMDVLQDMKSLPNPPKEIINSNEEFVINFVLNINGRNI